MSRTGHPLRILILGGSSFLGPHQIAFALGRGHAITTFTRGQTRPAIHQRLFNDVEALIGDRAGNLDSLRGRTWDAVIDNSGRSADWTRDSARLLPRRLWLRAGEQPARHRERPDVHTAGAECPGHPRVVVLRRRVRGASRRPAVRRALADAPRSGHHRGMENARLIPQSARLPGSKERGPVRSRNLQSGRPRREEIAEAGAAAPASRRTFPAAWHLNHIGNRAGA